MGEKNALDLFYVIVMIHPLVSLRDIEKHTRQTG